MKFGSLGRRFTLVVVLLSAAMMIALAQEATPPAAAGNDKAAVPLLEVAGGVPLAGDATANDGFTSVSPARLVDTRSGAATVDGANSGGGPVIGGGVVTVPVAGRGGVPAAGVGAVVLNVTATAVDAVSYLTVWPSGEVQPNASNVNTSPGATTPNLVIAKVGADGSVSVFNESGSLHLIVDVFGWFPAGSDFTGLNPARLLDTRGGPTVDGLGASGELAAGTSIDVRVAGRGGVPASGVGAVVVNVTATGVSTTSFLTVWPAGGGRPNASTLNMDAGATVANLSVVKLGADGSLSIFNESGATHVLVDVLGWFPADADLQGVDPARIVDTRAGAATVDGGQSGMGAVGSGGVIDVDVVGRGGVPDGGVGAVIVNVTAADPSEVSYLTVWPAGSSQPNASNLNLQAGRNVANAVIVGVGSGGKISIFNERGDTHLIVDVLGWLPLAANQLDNNAVVIPPGAAQVASGGPGSGAATFNVTGEQPTVGQVVVLTTATGEPFYGRVTSLDGGLFSASEVALADVIPILDLAFEVDTAGGSAPVVTQQSTLGAIEVGPSSVVPLAKFNCGNTSGASIQASVEANAGHFVFDVSWNKWGPVPTSLAYARIGYNPYISASLSAQASAGVTCSVSQQIASWDLPTIKFAIGPVPVWITQSMNLSFNGSLTASGAVSRTFSASASAWFGIEYQNGSWTRQASMNLSANDSSNSEIGLSIDARLPVRYQAKLYGVAGLDGTVEPRLNLDVRPTQRKYVVLTGRLDAAISGVFELDLQVKKFTFSTTFAKGTLWGPKELWSRSRTSPTPTTSPPTTSPSGQLPAEVTTGNLSGPAGIIGWATNVPCADGPVIITHNGTSAGYQGPYPHDPAQPMIMPTELDWAPGSYTFQVHCLSFQGDYDEYVVGEATVQVTGPARVIGVSKASAAPGETIVISDNGGCQPSPDLDRVTFRADDWYLIDVPISPSGRFGPLTVTVPPEISPGTYQISGHCSSSRAPFAQWLGGPALTITG